MLSFFPLDVLDEIWDVIESVSEEVLTYYCSYRNIIFPLRADPYKIGKMGYKCGLYGSYSGFGPSAPCPASICKINF